MAKAGRGDDQYMVRFPSGLRDKIKDAAERNGRSMNTEIIERLEGYEIVQWRLNQISEERDKLAAQLSVATDTIVEQRAIAAGLHKMLSEQANEAMAMGEADYDAGQAIEAKFNELKAQADYLEALKVELLELSKERDEIKNDAVELVKQQSDAIARLEKSQRSTASVLTGLQKVLQRAADGDDGELKKIIATFEVLDERGD